MMAALMERNCRLRNMPGCCFAARSASISHYSAQLPTMRYFGGGYIAGMHVSAEQIRNAGATSEHADGVVDYAIDADGVKMAYFARETDTGAIKVSLPRDRALPCGCRCGAF